jgi:hypothetical protein
MYLRHADQIWPIVLNSTHVLSESDTKQDIGSAMMHSIQSLQRHEKISKECTEGNLLVGKLERYQNIVKIKNGVIILDGHHSGYRTPDIEMGFAIQVQTMALTDDV